MGIDQQVMRFPTIVSALELRDRNIGDIPTQPSEVLERCQLCPPGRNQLCEIKRPQLLSQRSNRLRVTTP
jgi:hypothetical protein